MLGALNADARAAREPLRFADIAPPPLLGLERLPRRCITVPAPPADMTGAAERLAWRVAAVRRVVEALVVVEAPLAARL